MFKLITTTITAAALAITLAGSAFANCYATPNGWGYTYSCDPEFPSSLPSLQYVPNPACTGPARAMDRC
jgi:hypothetical protein